MLTNQLQLRLRGGFGKKVVDSCFGSDRSSGEFVVAGDHHRLDAHASQFAKTLFDAALDDIFEFDNPEDPRIVRYQKRRAAASRDLLHRRLNGFGKGLAKSLDLLLNGVPRAFAHLAPTDVYPTHARIGRERDKRCRERLQIALTQIEALLCEHDNAAAFRSLIGEGCELRRTAELLFADS